ncbi:hypothetical protein ABZ901_19870 [Actinacidiphila alni]
MTDTATPPLPPAANRHHDLPYRARSWWRVIPGTGGGAPWTP